MYSRLDPIFHAALPRQAEGTDTRQDIRREERTDEEGRKNSKNKDEKSPELWEDSTVVSVRALRAFLAGLIGSHSSGSHQDQTDVKVSIGPTSGDAPPPDTNAARAAKAYKTMYYTGQKEHQPPIPAPPAGDRGIKLSPDEERTIHKLIADIDTIARRGVETLNILKSDSFLQSLVDAVALSLRS